MLGEEQMQTDPVGPSILGERVAETAHTGGPQISEGEKVGDKSLEDSIPHGKPSEAPQRGELELPDDESVQTDYITDWIQRLRKEINDREELDDRDEIALPTLPITEPDVDLLESYLRSTGKLLSKWKRRNLPIKEDARSFSDLVNGFMSFVNHIVKTSDKLKDLELGQIDPDGSLDLELRSIQKSAIEAALEAYKKQSRQPPSVFAVILASYGRGVQDTQYVQEAFVTKYVGDAVKDLNQTLRQVYTDKPLDTTSKSLYAPVVALLQSSGSGKTRTAIQLSTLQVGLYVCVRPPPSLGHTTSAPPQDVSAYNGLVPANPNGDRNELDALIAVGSWLCAFAISFFELLQKHYSRQPPAPSWDEFVRNIAATLYNDIVPGFRVEGAAGFRLSPTAARIRALAEGSTSPNKSHLSIREKLLQDIHDLAESKRREFAKYAQDYRVRRGDDAQAPEKHIYAELKEALQKLQDMIPNEQDIIPNENYCYLAIDEAASLGPKRLVALRRCLSYHVFPKFRILLLDTSNKVADLTGMEVGNDVLPSSFRLGNETLYLAPPFTTLPHDVKLWKDPPQAEKYGAILTGTVKTTTTFKDIYDLLPLMGRPMLNDEYWCDRGRLNKRGAESLYAKLVASSASTTESSNTDEHNRTDTVSRTIAGASQRLPLDLIGVRGKNLL
jgi:hypothetical protein